MSIHPIDETSPSRAQAPSDPPRREAAWENEGGAARPSPKPQPEGVTPGYAGLLADYEDERRRRDDVLVGRMAAMREPS